jgi:hypothetical protein
LTRAEIDEMVRAIGSPGPLDAVLEGLSWTWPFVLSVALVVQYDRLWRTPTPHRVAMALALVLVGCVTALSIRWRALRRSGSRTARRP